MDKLQSSLDCTVKGRVVRPDNFVKLDQQFKAAQDYCDNSLKLQECEVLMRFQWKNSILNYNLLYSFIVGFYNNYNLLHSLGP